MKLKQLPVIAEAAVSLFRRAAATTSRALWTLGARGAHADARPPPAHVDPPSESRRAPDALASAQTAREWAVVDRRGGQRAIRVAHCIAGHCAERRLGAFAISL